MLVRKSTEADFARIMDIYASARAFMAAHGNPNQWGPTNWPPEELVQSDIATGRGYVCEHDGTVVGAFFFDQGRDIEPTYARIEGHSALSRWGPGDASAGLTEEPVLPGTLRKQVS